MSVENQRRVVPLLRSGAALLLVCAAWSACARGDHGRGPSAEAEPLPAPGPAASGAASAAAGAGTSSATSTSSTPSGSYLAFDREGRVVLTQPDGTSRIVSGSAASQSLDDAHGLLWSVSEDNLWVTDLRAPGSPLSIAEGVPASPAIWVHWPAQPAAEYVRPVSACEPGDVIEVVMGAKPRLRQVGQGRELPLREQGRRWLVAQAQRQVQPGGSQPGFEADAVKVTLPAAWAGCEDAPRCGLSASFGASAHRLVLVADRIGSDCWHRGCLLFDPATGGFASPPVVEDAATGALSLAPRPLRWSAFEAATPGVCGPYRFDAAGRQMLVRRFFCPLDGACRELEGETLGWSSPGPIVGEPG